MQTTGTALLAVERCSLVRVWMAAQDSRCAHGLLYFAAVRCTLDSMCPAPDAGALVQSPLTATPDFRRFGRQLSVDFRSDSAQDFCNFGSLVPTICWVIKHLELRIRQQILFQLLVSLTVGKTQAIGIIRVN